MEKTTKKTYLHLAIYLVIIAVFWYLPPIGPITPEGMRLLGLFIAFIVGFTITSDAWPALICLVLLPLTGLINFNGVLSLSFGSDTFFFIMLSLVLVAYVEASGAANFISMWLLSRKILKGHPWRLMFMLLFICWLLSSFVNAIAGMMLTWAFLYKIFGHFNYKPFDKLPTLLILGTCVVGGLGLSTLPWGNNSIVILDAFTNLTGLSVNYFLYMGFSIPYSIASILLYLAICRYLFRADVSALKDFNPEDLGTEDRTLTRANLIAMIAMVALILLILLPSCFPEDSIIVQYSNLFGLSGKLLLIFTVLQLIRLDGKHACNFPKIAKAGISWNILIVAANILIFSNMLGSEEAGISTFLSNSIGPIFEGHSTVLLIIIATVVTVVFTNFMVNKIVAIMMISMTMPVIQSLGLDPIQFVFLYTVVCTVAFILPSASQSAAVLFSNTEWVRAGDVFKFASPVILAMTLLMIVWNSIFFSVF